MYQTKGEQVTGNIQKLSFRSHQFYTVSVQLCLYMAGNKIGINQVQVSQYHILGFGVIIHSKIKSNFRFPTAKATGKNVDASQN